MYRQIFMNGHDRKYQRILWRSDPSQVLSIFELCTITYGIDPSAYQSIRSLYQLAADESNKFPNAVKLIYDNIYVDDALFEADNLEDAISIAQ